MTQDALSEFERISLDRLRLAADVILSEAEVLPDPLTAELTLFKERVEPHSSCQGPPSRVLAAHSSRRWRQ